MERMKQIETIAEFMDTDFQYIQSLCQIELTERGHRSTEILNNPEYWTCWHNDFSCLMEVVEKIESLGHGVEIIGNYCKIIGTDIMTAKENKIHAVYNSVMKFILWYNENK